MPTTKSAPKKRTTTAKSSEAGSVRKTKSRASVKPASKTRTTVAAKLPAMKVKRSKARKASVTTGNTSAKPRSSTIVETSPLTWSSKEAGPSFSQIQLAAYHSWLQNGGTEFDNWVAAEMELKRKPSGGSRGH
ncbi:MAG: DUF2934 domain-containing protein [Phycisphaerae bacterium]|nr:DUF2934 domain-containing protein [Phycisphaerae bacterium]